jgi:hypothetical protein
MLWMALLGGGLLGRKCVGYWLQRTVSVLLFLTFLMWGTCHRFVCLHHHPWMIAQWETMMVVMFAL